MPVMAMMGGHFKYREGKERKEVSAFFLGNRRD
jgi:hypothetical protein